MQGIKGRKGEIIESGKRVAAPPGDRGDNGYPGSVGLDGDQGIDGLPGITGERGEVGYPGLEGFAGSMGEF